MKKWIVSVALLCTTLGAVAQVDFDRKMQEAGLVDVAKLDTTLRVELMYATNGNFMGRNLYGSLRCAYLEPEFARKVVRAQQLLRARRPGWRLLICDAARPISIQRAMYKAVEGTPNQVYVANGTRGGRHNFGVAVDLTLLDATGHRADMGTPVDAFTEAAHTGAEPDLVARGLISQQAANNRWLLKSILREVGLVPYRREWWHYEQTIPMSEVRAQYRLLDF